MKQYIWNILVSLNQFFNTVFFGDPDETISSRAGKAAKKKERWACVLCRLLNWLEKDHCTKSIEPDEGIKE